MIAPELPESWIPSLAEQMTALGFRVFPLAPHSKVPRAGSPWKTDASLQVTGDGWDLATSYGVVPGDGFFVLDVDPLNGGDESRLDLEGKHGPLPATLTVQTPHGNGVHYYFRTSRPVGNSNRGLPPGLDVRGEDRGYGVGPGSRIHCDDGAGYCEKDETKGAHEGEYVQLSDCDLIADAPPWLLKLLESPRAEVDRVQRSPNGTELIRKGHRNDYLTREAGALLARGWTRDLTRATVRSINESMLEESLSEDELERTVFRSMESWERGDIALSSQPYDPALILRADKVVAPRLEPLVHSGDGVLIARMSATQIVSAEGGGKTTFLQHLALSLATGTSMLGFTVEQASVLYVGVDRPVSQQDSVTKLRDLYGDPGDLLYTYFGSVGDLLREPDTLLHMAREHDSEVLILDSLYALVPTGQSMNDDMWARALNRSAATLASNGITLLVAAHPPRKTDDRDRTTNAHGSRFQSAGMDNIINLTGTGTVTVRMPKGFGGVKDFSFIIDGTTRTLRRLDHAPPPVEVLRSFGPDERITKAEFASRSVYGSGKAAEKKANDRLTELEEMSLCEVLDPGSSGGRGGGRPKVWKRVTDRVTS